MSQVTVGLSNNKRKRSYKDGIVYKARKEAKAKRTFGPSAKLIRNRVANGDAGVEIKTAYVPVTQATVAAASTFQFINLNGMIEGTDNGNRVGRRITMKSLDLRVMATMNTTSGFQTLRHGIIVDTQNKGNALAAGPWQNGGITNVTAQRTEEDLPRFIILKDEMIDFQNVAQTRKTTHWYVKLKDLVTQYNTGNTGGAADINVNGLYYFFIWDSVANAPSYSMYSKLNYCDF